MRSIPAFILGVCLGIGLMIWSIDGQIKSGKLLVPSEYEDAGVVDHVQIDEDGQITFCVVFHGCGYGFTVSRERFEELGFHQGDRVGIRKDRRGRVDLYERANVSLRVVKDPK